MIVNWHNKVSKEEDLTGGGPQGGYLGNLEYTAQSNKSAKSIKKDSRFKLVDDLTALERKQILTIGLTSFSVKLHVPSNINQSTLYIPNENLQPQTILDQIKKRTTNAKMELNKKKIKNMQFNFTKTKQFWKRIQQQNLTI